VGDVLDVHAPEQVERITGEGFDVAGTFRSEVGLQPGDFAAAGAFDALLVEDDFDRTAPDGECVEEPELASFFLTRRA